MEGFGDLDEFTDLPVDDDLVEPAHRVDAEDPSPFLVFLEDLEQAWLRFKGRQLFRVLAFGDLQHEARWVRNQFE